jgi:hypothetical protein
MKQYFIKHIGLVCCLFFSCFSALANIDTVAIPLYRQYFHDKIIAEQKLCDKADGKTDNFMRIGNNDEINLRVTDALFRKTNDLREWIELNNKIEKNNDKIYLRRADSISLKRSKEYQQEVKAVEMAPLFLFLASSFNVELVYIILKSIT